MAKMVKITETTHMNLQLLRDRLEKREQLNVDRNTSWRKVQKTTLADTVAYAVLEALKITPRT